MGGMSYGQDLSNYYTPYGFRFPYLDKGEYSLSLGSNFQRYKYKYDYPDSDNDLISKSKNTIIFLGGLYGISKRFLFSGSISYYPSLTSNEYYSYYYDPFNGTVTSYKDKSELKSYVAPSATLLFRPNSRIELYADYSTYVSHTDRVRIIDSASELQQKLKNEYYYVRVGVNIIGKL